MLVPFSPIFVADTKILCYDVVASLIQNVFKFKLNSSSNFCSNSDFSLDSNLDPSLKAALSLILHYWKNLKCRYNTKFNC